jgi:hypothetical protein
MVQAQAQLTKGSTRPGAGADRMTGMQVAADPWLHMRNSLKHNGRAGQLVASRNS